MSCLVACSEWDRQTYRETDETKTDTRTKYPLRMRAEGYLDKKIGSIYTKDNSFFLCAHSFIHEFQPYVDAEPF